MRYKKANLLLVLSMGLIMFSFLFIVIWGYNKYFKSENQEYNTGNSTLGIADSLKGSIVNGVPADSVINVKSENQGKTVSSFDSAMDSIAMMQQELAGIIPSSATKAELEIIRRKLEEVNRRIDALEKKQAVIQQDNLKLQNSLAGLSGPKIESTPSSIRRRAVGDNKKKVRRHPVARNARKAEINKNRIGDSGEKVIDEKEKNIPEAGAGKGRISVRPSSHKTNVALISSIKLSASYSQGNDEYKTNESVLAEKFSGSILFKNAGNPSGGVADVYLVVYRPDGKLLNSGWESGSFTTFKGKMTYTTRISFDCGPSESKNVGFSIYSDRFQKGRYSLYAYVNGKLAGTAFKTLE